MMDKEKYVDESWKEQAFEEKDKLTGLILGQTGDGPKAADEPVSTGDEDQDQAQAGEVNFFNYVTSLGFQALIFMGEIPNPMTNEVEKNMDQAKFLIDTLDMIKEKTAGNLSQPESELLENSIYELQTRYVQIVQGELK
jgi:hypothetical protein